VFNVVSWLMANYDDYREKVAAGADGTLAYIGEIRRRMQKPEDN
jgi:hypothetical protein